MNVNLRVLGQAKVEKIKTASSGHFRLKVGFDNTGSEMVVGRPGGGCGLGQSGVSCVTFYRARRARMERRLARLAV